MSASISQQDNTWVLSGELNHQTVPGLYPQMPTSNGPNIHLDLSAVHKSDSAGVALLLHWTQNLHTAGQQLLLSHTPPQLSQMIHILAVAPQLNIEA